MFRVKDEPKWCEAATGKIIMVREDDQEFIAVDVFVAFEPDHPQPFKCELARHSDARPMSWEEFCDYFHFE